MVPGPRFLRVFCEERETHADRRYSKDDSADGETNSLELRLCSAGDGNPQTHAVSAHP